MQGNGRKIRLVECKSPGKHVYSGISLPRLGLPIIGTILKSQEYNIRIYCEDLEKIDYDDLYSADLVGISSITPTANISYKLADDLSQRNIPVVMGGPHPAFLPDEALMHAPYCIRGEGEYSFPELLECIFNNIEPKEIAGLSYIHNGVVTHNPDRQHILNLDDIPFPDLKLIHGSGKIRIQPVLTSRGCPYDCIFCSVTGMFGHKYRMRSVDNVIEELLILKPRQIFFYDDNFAANPARTKALCESMIKHNIDAKWGAQTRVDVADDPELLGIMHRSGCRILYIGFESANPQTLKAYRKRQQIEDIERCIKKVHDHGILIHGMFVAGSDEDDLHSVMGTLNFALKNKIDTLQLSLLTPLPGTKLFDDLNTQDRILTSNWSYYDGHHVVFKPRNMSAYELQKISLDINRQFYSPLHYIKSLFQGNFYGAYLQFHGSNILREWEKENTNYSESLLND